MRLSRVASDRRPRLLGVFAHPDDEVFCAGGTLARWAAAGHELMVVSATRGEAGQIQDGSAATRRTLGAVRERELREACARLGVQRAACLDYHDGALPEVDEESLARDVAACINEFRPDVVITFGPDGGTGHPDHIAISAATTRACQQIAGAVDRGPHLYYSAFPRQHRLLCYQLARWLAQRDSQFRGSDACAHALALLAREATLLGYADDAVEVRWFPAGVSLAEQGEQATGLFLIISGHADVIREDTRGTRSTLSRMGPGQFFGAEALARLQPQDASLVAVEPVTCLVLSARETTPFDGRGEEARPGGSAAPHDHDAPSRRGAPARLDVAVWLDQKIAALAAHYSQFALDPAVLPRAVLEQWLGNEYFVSAAHTHKPRAYPDVARQQAAEQSLAVPA